MADRKKSPRERMVVAAAALLRERGLSGTSFSEVIELSTSHARKQFEAVSEQTKELAALAQKVATESAEPLKSGVTKAFRKVA